MPRSNNKNHADALTVSAPWPRNALPLLWILIVGGFFYLAWDGRLHWDEPSYLYAGAYLSIPEILGGEFQPSGIEGMNLSKIFHVLLVHGVVAIVGVGIHALATVIVAYLVLLLVFGRVTFLILRELLPNDVNVSAAVIVTAFTPIYLYLAFKTLPEIPALLLVAVACLALLRSLSSHVFWHLGVAAVSLAAMALFKNTMAILYPAMVVAMVSFRGLHFPPVKLIAHATVAGVASLLLFWGALQFMSIEFSSYLAVGALLLEREEPLAALLLSTALEGGIFFLAIPLAFLARRKEALFFTLWFLLSTLPLILAIDHIESRYLAPNLVPLSGLIHLTLVRLWPSLKNQWQRSRLRTAVVAGFTILVVALSNVAALAVMTHEVEIKQFHSLLKRLDRLYGGTEYIILIPWMYTDFHYLRFAYPDRAVYSVQSIPFRTYPPGEREAFIRRYYEGQVIHSVDDLLALDRPLVYLGFDLNFSVANLRRLAHLIPGDPLRNYFEIRTFRSHLELSWMWKDPEVTLSEEAQSGHYVAYTVNLTDPAAKTRSGRNGTD